MAGAGRAKSKKPGAGVVNSSETKKSFHITRIKVNLSNQKLYAYAGEALVYEFNVFTGRPGHRTDAGTFRIFKKDKDHVSGAYKDASGKGYPMPYSMFFSSDGKAIHQSPLAFVRSYAMAWGLGDRIDAVGSHGCVGLSESDAKALFERTPVNTTVEIVSAEE